LLSPQLVPELIEVGARIYIKKEIKKEDNDRAEMSFDE